MIRFNRGPERRVRIIELRMKKLLRKRVERVARSILRNVRFNLNNRILHRRSSRLYFSFSHTVTPIPDGYRLAIGSPLPYARIHDTGGMAGRNHASRIPKRNYFRKAVVKSKKVIRREFRQYLVEVMK